MKAIKKYLPPILALVALCALSFFATSCNQPAPAEQTVTVTVKDRNGDPVVGAAIQLCEGETCKKPKPTGENGIATFTFVPSGEQLKVRIETYPEGYSGSTEYTPLGEGQTELTLTVTKNRS